MDCATFIRNGSLIIAIAICFSGCKNGPPPDFPDPMQGILPAQGNEGFDLVMKAASAVEQDAGNLITRSDWTPGTRKRALTACSRGLGLLRQGLDRKAKFAFAPYAPDQTRPSVRGWRFLGMAMKWRIEDAVDSARFDAASEDVVLALRFASLLQGGDTSIASLGVSIATNAAKAAWTAFPKMSPNQLQSLGIRAASVLKNLPPPTATIESEKATMMAGVEWVFTAFRSKQLDGVAKALGKPAGPVIRYLNELSGKSKSDQVAFFKGLIEEGNDEAATLRQRAEASHFDGTEWEEPRGERPWRRLSAALFRSGRYFLEERARFDAEMRLFSIDSQLLSRFKRSGGVPPDLSKLAKWLRTDPFSGRDFAYSPQGSDYRLYSVGADGVDNGGQPPNSGNEGDIVPSR